MISNQELRSLHFLLKSCMFVNELLEQMWDEKPSTGGREVSQCLLNLQNAQKQDASQMHDVQMSVTTQSLQDELDVLKKMYAPVRINLSNAAQICFYFILKSLEILDYFQTISCFPFCSMFNANSTFYRLNKCYKSHLNLLSQQC